MKLENQKATAKTRVRGRGPDGAVFTRDGCTIRYFTQIGASIIWMPSKINLRLNISSGPCTIAKSLH
ncbi:hypothetical protein ES288_D05G175900v1 [Gossypium darwinii]|uniref:Uncharacterized protein n=2 Tax=Gossypium TaxID=3633 RepID=A0A5D2KWB4_GOSTO|nr:hypothetical protein ES288_D05G175900v1 [Gossypium darwinii]TYH71280.1 hypothetical protein ES332_D05G175500v1 [Gossypium tomentosum]